MTKHHDLLTTDPTALYDDLTRPFIPARLHLDAARRHILARPSLVETADKLDATQQLVDELNERLAAVTGERDRLREELAAVELKHRYAVHVVKDQAGYIGNLHSRCRWLRAALLAIISRPGEAEQVARLAVMEDGQS